jgi:hypothetical protein
MATQLYDMNIDEVSLVDKGANQEAFIVLMKKKNTKKENGEDFPSAAYAYVPDPEKPSTWKLRLWETNADKVTAVQVGRAVAALGKGFRGNKVSIPTNDLEAVKRKVLSAWLSVNSSKTREEAPDVLKILKGFSEGKTFDEVLENEETRRLLWQMVDILESSVYSILHDDNINDKPEKILETTGQFQAKLSEIMGGDTQMSKELEQKLDDLQKKYDALLEENKTLKKTTEDNDIDKSNLPEAVKKRLDDLEKNNKEQTETIAKMLDAKETEIYVAKAKSFPALAIDVAPFGEILKKVSRSLDEKEFDTLMNVLKGANEAVTKSALFAQEGSDAGGVAMGDALKKMEAATTEIQKNNPTMTKEQAFSKVMTENPKLYAEYLKDKAVN